MRSCRTPASPDRRAAAVLAAALVVAAGAGIAAADPKPPPALVVPFRYSGFGMGEGPVDGQITLSKNSEADFVSRALVSTLQDRQYALVEPKVTLGAPLPQGKTWTTDVVPVSADTIAAHNRAHPEMSPLPPRYYSVQYSGQYKLQNRELVFAISAQLYERAAATTPRKYRGPYSGTFFVDPLSAALRAKLIQQSAPPP